MTPVDDVEAAKRAWLAKPVFQPDTTIDVAAASSWPAWIVGRVAAPNTVHYSRPPEGSDDVWSGQVITQRYLLLTTRGRWYLATDAYDPAFAQPDPTSFTATEAEATSTDGPGVAELTELGDPSLVELARDFFAQRS